MYSDIQPPSDFYRPDPSIGWYNDTEVNWHEVHRKRYEEDMERQLLVGMGYHGQPAFSLRGWFNRLGNWAAEARLHLRRMTMDTKGTEPRNVYRIKIKETLNRSIGILMGEVDILPQENGGTVLVGAFIDQSALRGLLDQLWNLNFTILSIEHIEGAMS